MAITTAPVTTGGISRSIQRVPTFITTTTPIRGVDPPQAIIIPRANRWKVRIESCPLKPVTAINHADEGGAGAQFLAPGRRSRGKTVACRYRTIKSPC